MKGGKAGLALGALLLVVPLLVIVMVMGSSTPPCDQQGAGGPGMGALASGGIPVEFVPLLQRAGTLCPAFPAPVLAAQIQQESGFRQHGANGAGASGYTQFIAGTWASYGKDTTGKGFADVNNASDA
ncbi:MAG: peptidoglycan DD-metalloendopeptidase family protein, partial [Mycobacteriaceae bacterium]